MQESNLRPKEAVAARMVADKAFNGRRSHDYYQRPPTYRQMSREEFLSLVAEAILRARGGYHHAG